MTQQTIVTLLQCDIVNVVHVAIPPNAFDMTRCVWLETVTSTNLHVYACNTFLLLMFYMCIKYCVPMHLYDLK